jgi:elongator complex protein 3
MIDNWVRSYLKLSLFLFFMEEFYRKLIEEIINQGVSDPEGVMKLRRELCREFKPKVFPSLIQILLHAKEEELPKLKFIITKPTRTLSGVTPLAIMTSPEKCPHGKCIMCPGGPDSHYGDVPQSYTGKEPATMRGIRNKFDPYLQVFNRLEQYSLLNQSSDKVELIVMGGTFPARDKEYQEEFVMYALKAMNDFGDEFFGENGLKFDKFKEFFELPGEMTDERTRNIHKKILKLKGSSSLVKEQDRNEKTKIRCVALCIETRPDYGKKEHGLEMLRLGCTRVELGIQSVDDDVLEKIERGHSVADTAESIKDLRDLGFKISAHYMPGLPGVKDELEEMKKLFSDERFKPDMIKLYPCIITKGTKAYEMWEKGEFEPITTGQAAELIVKFKKYVPEYCRIQRIQRDISGKEIEAGVDMTNLRQHIHNGWNVTCRCIRCREVGRAKKLGSVRLEVMEYNASEGKEYFISVVDEFDNLYGFCRLRFPSDRDDESIVRELHVYSTAVNVGGKSEKSFQHRGLGKRLMAKAEELSKGRKVVVISGIGVREYYRKIGYVREGFYMVKEV